MAVLARPHRRGYEDEVEDAEEDSEEEVQPTVEGVDHRHIGRGGIEVPQHDSNHAALQRNEKDDEEAHEHVLVEQCEVCVDSMRSTFC